MDLDVDGRFGSNRPNLGAKEQHAKLLAPATLCPSLAQHHGDMIFGGVRRILQSFQEQEIHMVRPAL